MQPPKYGELLADSAIQDALLDKMIETDINYQLHERDAEPEQEDFDFRDEKTRE